MQTIYKYSIERLGVTQITVPKGAKLLRVGIDPCVTPEMRYNSSHSAHGLIEYMCLWIQVDTESELEIRRFAYFGTGHSLDTIKGSPIPYTLEYVDSCISPPFIWHVYELVAKEA